jgi:hypothetical protein
MPFGEWGYDLAHGIGVLIPCAGETYCYNVAVKIYRSTSALAMIRRYRNRDIELLYHGFCGFSSGFAAKRGGTEFPTGIENLGKSEAQA